MTKLSVCNEWSHAHGHGRFLIDICGIIEWNARHLGGNRCRSTSTNSVFISLKKKKTNIKDTGNIQT